MSIKELGFNKQGWFLVSFGGIIKFYAARENYLKEREDFRKMNESLQELERKAFFGQMKK